MEKVRELTKEEKEPKKESKIMKVSETHCFFWHCKKCGVAFFGDDEILVCSDGYNKCLNKSKKLFNKTVDCHYAIYGGNEKYFNENYKITS